MKCAFFGGILMLYVGVCFEMTDAGGWVGVLIALGILVAAEVSIYWEGK